eukprot:scaffold129839_cov21-Tisochrysis_lutea.AAC.1
MACTVCGEWHVFLRASSQMTWSDLWMVGGSMFLRCFCDSTSSLRNGLQHCLQQAAHCAWADSCAGSSWISGADDGCLYGWAAGLPGCVPESHTGQALMFTCECARMRAHTCARACCAPARTHACTLTFTR